MTDAELDLVETERLVDALGRRFPAVLVAVTRDLGDIDEGAVPWWRGSWIAAVGLARFAEDYILHRTPTKRRSADD